MQDQADVAARIACAGCRSQEHSRSDGYFRVTNQTARPCIILFLGKPRPPKRWCDSICRARATKPRRRAATRCLTNRAEWRPSRTTQHGKSLYESGGARGRARIVGAQSIPSASTIHPYASCFLFVHRTDRCSLAVAIHFRAAGAGAALSGVGGYSCGAVGVVGTWWWRT